MPHTHLNGFDLYYEAAGQGEPVVFVHGGFPSLATALTDVSQWHWTWENDFADLFHFISYDRRGCYRSSAPASGYKLENQALDLVQLLDHLKLPTAHIVASSAGGPIALTFAALFPQRVRSLVLAGTGLDFFPIDDPISNLLRQQIATLENEGVEAAFAQRPAGVETSFETLWVAGEMRARGRYAEFLAREQQQLSRVQALPAAERLYYFAVELRAMQAYMQRDALRTYARHITAPTLILHGSDDRTIPLAWGEKMAALISTARKHILPGAGHSLVHRSVEGRQIVISYLQETKEY